MRVRRHQTANAESVIMVASVVDATIEVAVVMVASVVKTMAREVTITTATRSSRCTD
jgi:hypothetical protein